MALSFNSLKNLVFSQNSLSGLIKKDSISTIISYGMIPLPSAIISKILLFLFTDKYGQTVKK